MTKNAKHNLKNKGFTLVELIVVLVILAILAAILTPTLLGYIDHARSKKTLLNAQACLDAARGAFIELYGKNGDVPEATPVVSGARKQSGGDSYDLNKDKKGNKDQDITNTEFAQNILKMAGMTGAQQPYLFMVAVGSNAKYRSDANYTRSTAQQKYTIYYGVYIEKKGQKPWYYYNGEWTEINPTANKGSITDPFNQYNVFQSGPLAGIRVQYYLISNQTAYQQKSIDEGKFWDSLRAGTL